MKDYLISMFIDDELDLDEKIEFVETVHGDARVKDETVGLLNQEKWLREDLMPRMAPLPMPAPRRRRLDLGIGMARWWRSPLAGFAAALVLIAAVWGLHPKAPAAVEKPYRFVLFNPTARQIQLVGSFTQWVPVPMQPSGASGYWSLTVDLPAGEHRYSFVVGDGRQMPDPTVLSREKDDFGGENSIIRIDEAV